MAKTILTVKCPSCGKLAKETKREEFGTELFISLECGHTIIKEALVSDDLDITSSDGRSLFKFQKETVTFAEDADCNCLILHEQGLGKTVIECALLKRNPQLLPALIVVKSGLRAQWFAEIFRWTGMPAQVITSSKEQPYFEFFKIIIVSIDTLRLIRPDVKVISEWDEAKAEAAGRKLKRGSNKPLWSDATCAQFKHICVDEIQKVKNSSASRTQALRKITSLANNGQKARFIGLSGTPIDKHAGEFFNGLNMTRPELFPQESRYYMNDCMIKPETGKIGGLRDPERFREKTKDFIIRYKRTEVLPDLPRVFRQFRLADIEGDELQAYISIVKEFQEYMEDPETPKIPTDILGYLSRMRHVTGIAKVGAAIDFIEEFLLESDRKIVIFLHHKEAAKYLMLGLEKLCLYGRQLRKNEKLPIPTEPAFNPPLYLSADLDPLRGRPALIEEFRKPGNRIMVASELASAEGLNLQFVQDCLFMERQWNPTTEEQCEGRFPRPRPEDPWPVDAKIMAHYLIAAGTIDDFLTDIVEEKRRNVNQTLDGEEGSWDSTSLQTELTRALLSKGLRKWKLVA